jgi:hypothetical protein
MVVVVWYSQEHFILLLVAYFKNGVQYQFLRLVVIHNCSHLSFLLVGPISV